MTEPKWRIMTLWRSGVAQAVAECDVASTLRTLRRARLVLKAWGCHGEEMAAHYHDTAIYPKEVRVR